MIIIDACRADEESQILQKNLIFCLKLLVLLWVLRLHSRYSF